ncbi:MAG TPA: DUF4062 domain-containing protein [Longimicrobium sp.]
MTQKKKLQVFVSSTYQDLRAERQAAVEAILTAGHIPAGMELFAAGDQSQMKVIENWIDESDVFLLVLGGRYGSIEPNSGKSYIHLEYEYAVARGKPVFAVVIEEQHRKERIKILGEIAIETENASKLRDFRDQVLGTRLVRFWSDPRDIKLAIHETMAELIRRDDLVGWVPRAQNVDTGALAEQLARLAKENSDLRKIAESSVSVQLYNGLRYEELLDLLRRENFECVPTDDPYDTEFVDMLRGISKWSSQDQPTIRDVVWVLRTQVIPTIQVDWSMKNLRRALRRLEYYGIVTDIDKRGYESQQDSFKITRDGQRFILRLIVEGHRHDSARQEPDA